MKIRAPQTAQVRRKKMPVFSQKKQSRPGNRGGFADVKQGYSRKISCSRQMSIISRGQTEAWTSPMWAQRSISMHRRDWPMPPPMV